MKTLFPIVGAGAPCAPEPLSVATPLGSLTAGAVVDSTLLSADHAVGAVRFPTGALWMEWRKPGIFRAEALLSKASYQPAHEDLRVDGLFVVFWRIQALVGGVKPGFDCRWDPGYTWVRGGSDCGERLDAQTWSGPDRTIVTVGTVDEDIQEMVAGQIVTTHVVIAWKNQPASEDDVAPWLAVGSAAWGVIPEVGGPVY